MSKHTPGPWNPWWKEDFAIDEKEVVRLRTELAKTCRQRDDLLAACEACMEAMKRWGAEEDGMPEDRHIAAWQAYQQAKAAIARAEGEQP